MDFLCKAFHPASFSGSRSIITRHYQGTALTIKADRVNEANSRIDPLITGCDLPKREVGLQILHARYPRQHTITHGFDHRRHLECPRRAQSLAQQRLDRRHRNTLCTGAKNPGDSLSFTAILNYASISRSADAINLARRGFSIRKREIHRPGYYVNRVTFFTFAGRIITAGMPTNLSQNASTTFPSRCFILKHQQYGPLAQDEA